MSLCHLQGKKLLVTGLLAGIVLNAGCNGGEESQPPSAKPEEKNPTTETATTPSATTPAAVDVTRPVAGTTAVPAAQGVVLANKELGMAVSGPGAGNPGRS